MYHVCFRGFIARSYKNINRVLRNVICAWHKTKNFKLHLPLQGEQRIMAINLWKEYIYNKNEQVSSESYCELFNLVPNVTKEYLNN